jgi:pimeloyl-ACP methyl ester carboxylesterase
MARLAFTRAGSGSPLVLLHGIGLSRRTWDPIVPALAEHFDVLAIDLAGFGESEPLPPQVEPTPAALAASVADFLDDLGIGVPHIVGNSLGGWVALEFAHLRPTASLTLLSPAGLWRGDTPLYCRASLRASRWLTQHASGLLYWLVKRRLGRTLVLGQTHGQPSKMSADQARAVVSALGASLGFDATLAATATRRYRAGPPINAPVTVAFGSRDRLLLPWQSRHLDELPAGTQLITLPRCGHVPMGDNPTAVTALITAATERSLGRAPKEPNTVGDSSPPPR